MTCGEGGSKGGGVGGEEEVEGPRAQHDRLVTCAFFLPFISVAERPPPFLLEYVVAASCSGEEGAWG